MRFGGRMIETSDSLQEGPMFHSLSRKSGYASGHCIPKPLPHLCYDNMHATRWCLSVNCKQMTAPKVKHV